jgi:hypothetical protein
MSLSDSLLYLFKEINLKLKTVPFLLFGIKYFELGLTKSDRLYNLQIKEF